MKRLSLDLDENLYSLIDEQAIKRNISTQGRITEILMEAAAREMGVDYARLAGLVHKPRRRKRRHA